MVERADSLMGRTRGIVPRGDCLEEIDPIVCTPKAGDGSEISVKRNRVGHQILGWIRRNRMGITVIVLQPPERDDCPTQRAPEMIDVEVIHLAHEQPESVYLPKYDRVRPTGS